MSNSKTGGPAFPSIFGNVPESVGEHGRANGLSVRDYFAGKALVGLFSGMPNTGEEVSFDANGLAANAYQVADAMIAERAK